MKRHPWRPPTHKHLDLAELQVQQATWKARNFPGQLPHQALLGVAEEAGELAHAHLKAEQGIRGYTFARYVEEATDAIGDIVIYLASYCNANGLSLEEAVWRTWIKVRERDWTTYPETGSPPSSTTS